MKKKKQRQISITTAAAAVDGGDDLKSIIHSHNEFFNHLIELIPARFYLSNDDAESKPWYQGLSKAAKASLKQQSKQNLKLARRQRYDPEGEPSSVLQQRQNGKSPISDEGIFAGLEEDESGVKRIDTVGKNKEKSVTLEELRERLRKKMESLRGNRGEKRSDERRVKFDGKKRKRGEENDDGEHLDEEDDDDDGEEIIEYGKVRLGDEDEGKRDKKKKKKLPRAKELEKVKKNQEMKRENPSVAERESWKAATSRAMGVKVHDDARLIKESMRKEKRKKEKNAEKWKERVQTQEKMKEERQKKRKDNIAGRINEKKMRKIAKREKKLMRPGFEGRKEGFITNE